MNKTLPILMMVMLCGCDSPMDHNKRYINAAEKDNCSSLTGYTPPITCELNRMNRVLSEIKELLKAQRGK